MSRLSEQTVDAFAALVAGDEPAPGGGACAAVACALGAALVEMAASFTLARDELADRHVRMREIAERAAQVRAQALPLADRDVIVYGAVIDALRLPAGAEREQRLGAALSQAADVPLQIAELGAEVCELGAELLRDGNPNLAGDAAMAVRLGDAAAAGAARLVAINLRARPDDARLAQAAALTLRAGGAGGGHMATEGGSPGRDSDTD